MDWYKLAVISLLLAVLLLVCLRRRLHCVLTGHARVCLAVCRHVRKPGIGHCI